MTALDDLRADVERVQFKPCGHSALGCYNSAGACCRDCDHPTYWRDLDDAADVRRIELAGTPGPERPDPLELRLR